jgi:hydroxymethylglutaryl-CoA reductase
VIASVGLAQNLAALRALSTEGIQRGHMALHARNIAIAAGAEGARIDEIAKELVRLGDVSADRAQILLNDQK